MASIRNDIEFDELNRQSDIIYNRSSERSPFLDAGLAFLKRPWITLLTIILITSPAAIYIFTRPDVFQSQGVISTGSPNVMSAIGLDKMGGRGSEEYDDYYYMSILESNAYYDRVVDGVLKARPDLLYAADSINMMVRTNVVYTKKPRSIGFFIISAQASTSEFAKFLAEIAVSSFEHITTELRRRETNLVADFIQKQLEQLGNNLANIESQIQSFLENRNVGFTDQYSGVDTELRMLQNSFSEAQTARDLAKLKIDNYTAQLNERVTQYLAGSNENGESTRLRDLNEELKNISKLVTDSLVQTDSLQFVRLQTKRQEILKELADLVSGKNQSDAANRGNRISAKGIEDVLQGAYIDYETAQIRCIYFQREIDRFIDENPNLSKDMLEFFTLTRTKSVLQKTTDILVEMREKTRIQLASETGGVKVIDYPGMPNNPVSQRRGMKLLAAFLAALAIGIIISYSVDKLDNTVQGEADLQNRFNLPIYGSLPVMGTKDIQKSRQYVKENDAVSNPNLNGHADKRLNYYSKSSPVSEAYHSIKTAIQFTGRDRSKKAFVITSPVASDGKSLTTYNLAVSFSYSGLKVLIIDADLRRSSQHKLFECPRNPGLTDYLHGTDELENCIFKGNESGVHLMPAGTHISNPAELLSSNLMKEFFATIEPMYDLILVDTPPIAPCMDSRHLALLTGGMILVVRAEKTKLNILEHCLNLVYRSNVEILGVIVNHAASRYGYGYYYLYQHYNPYGYYYSGYNYYYSHDSTTGEKVRKQKHKTKETADT